MAAQYAAKQGTTVFSVAYGSEDTGCNSGWTVGLTDTTLVASSNCPETLNQTFTLAQLTPCVTMENIASSLNNFYSDYNQSGSGSTCQDASHTVTSLQEIFLAIASGIHNAATAAQQRDVDGTRGSKLSKGADENSAPFLFVQAVLPAGAKATWRLAIKKNHLPGVFFDGTC